MTNSVSLRVVLWVDGVTGLGTLASQLVAASFLSDLYGLPLGLIRGAMLAMLFYLALIATLIFKPNDSMFRLGVLVGGNLAWVAASLWVAFGADLGLTPLGRGYVIAQAAFVMALAVLETVFSRAQRGDLANEEPARADQARA